MEGQLVPDVSHAEALIALPDPGAPLPPLDPPTPADEPSFAPQPPAPTLDEPPVSDSPSPYAGVADPSGVVVLHVRDGSEYHALLYLLRSVSRHFRMDDLLPDVPAHAAEARYLLLRSPGAAHCGCRGPPAGAGPGRRAQRCAAALAPHMLAVLPCCDDRAAACAVKMVDGDAATLFEAPTHPPGLLVSRTTTQQQNQRARPLSLMPRPGFSPHALDTEGQTRLLFGGIVQPSLLDTRLTTPPDASIATAAGDAVPSATDDATRPGTTSSAAERAQSPQRRELGSAGARAGRAPSPFARDDRFVHVAQVSTRQARAWLRQAAASRLVAIPAKPLLVPVALPLHAGFLQMAAEAIITFNKRGARVRGRFLQVLLPLTATLAPGKLHSKRAACCAWSRFLTPHPQACS